MSDNQAIQRALEWERIAGSPARTQFNWSRRMLLAMRDFTGGGGGGGTTFSDADFELYNEITNSKVAMFDVSVISGSTTRTFTLPDADGTIVLLTAAQTLLNKTLTQPTIDMGTNQITNAGNPTLPQDVVTKAYADALVTGEFWSDVAVATTANVTLGSDLDIGDTIDGYVLVAGDRILVKDQTDQTENGLYDVGGTRSADAAIADDIEERKAIPLNGTAGANTLFFNTNSEITLGVTNIEFVKLLVDAVPPVAVTTFADGSFAVYNTTDITKEILFDASGIATGTSRTITMPDADGQILSATEYTDLTDAGDSALHYHDTDRARANHTGTQLAATISDLATAVNGIVASETIDNIFRIKDNADNTKEIAFEASTISHLHQTLSE